MRYCQTLSVLLIVFWTTLTGCGGHEGGVVDIPLSENPYQLSELEQRRINDAIDETSGLTEEEIEQMKEAEQATDPPTDPPADPPAE